MTAKRQSNAGFGPNATTRLTARTKKPGAAAKRRAQAERWAYWKPIIARQGDFDYREILDMLRHKLHRTRKHMLEHNIIADAKRVASQMAEVIALLDRVRSDFHEDRLFKPFYRKHHHTLVKHRRATLARSSTAGGARLDPKVRRIQRELQALAARAARLEARDLKRSFDLMAKNIWRWWD
jgi:hypothetical protein